MKLRAKTLLLSLLLLLSLTWLSPAKADVIQATGQTALAFTQIVTAAASNNLIISATPKNLYGAYLTNHTNSSGFLVLVDSATVPADGAITPIECVALNANGTASISYIPGPPLRFGTGIVAIATSAATCFTKTTGVITGFIKGLVQ